MLEKSVKLAVKDLLKRKGAYWFMPVQMGYGATSLDFLGCYKGQFFAIECKRPGATPQPTPRQMAALQEIDAAGGHVCVENDIECPKVLSMLEQIDYEHATTILVRQGSRLADLPTGELSFGAMPEAVAQWLAERALGNLAEPHSAQQPETADRQPDD